MNDPVNHPAHYTSSPAACAQCGKPIECIDVTKHMSFPIGSAVKYLWRCDLKNAAVEDLEKAKKYIEFEIEKRRGEAVKPLGIPCRSCAEEDGCLMSIPLGGHCAAFMLRAATTGLCDISKVNK